jgi:putative CocE/NonD family hydrolase
LSRNFVGGARALAFSWVALGSGTAFATHGYFDALRVPPEKYSVMLEKSVMVPMRDGVKLSTDIYRPVGVPGPLPVVMMRTPYGKLRWRRYTEAREAGRVAEPREQSDPYLFASRGYIVVIQDHRGRHESEGTFFPYPRTDGLDGYDTISWIVGQSWSSGKVGTIGCSYLGETQHMLASHRHPNHTAAIAMAGTSSSSPGGVLNFGFMRYGMTSLAAAAGWSATTGPALPQKTAAERLAALATLPVRDVMTALYGMKVPTSFEEWLEFASLPGDDYWWVRQGTITAADRFDVPALHISSWYDGTPSSTLDLYQLFSRNAETARARDNQYLIMSASLHCQFEEMTAQGIVGDRYVGDATLDYRAIYLHWFDHWLRGGESIAAMPKVSTFALGRGAWSIASRWPLPGTRAVKWLLSSATRGANSRNGDGELSLKASSERGRTSDSYIYDPTFPVPSVGGAVCCVGAETKAGGVDQREVELRNDVLVYTSPPLEEPMEIAGPMRAELFVSSTARDTDFIVRLVDVYPDGKAYNIQEGVIRARWRNGFDKPVWFSGDEVVPITVEIEATHSYLRAGHRLRVDITSSSFPMWDRNLNTGGPNHSESRPVVAINRVHHSSAYPSAIVLPTVP